MGYIKKAHREILKILDDTPSFPNGWDNFVDKQAVYHNLGRSGRPRERLHFGALG